MLKNLRTKLIASGALVAGLAALAPAAAHAVPVTGTIDVPAGQRRCIDNPQIGYATASVTDFVVSGHKVKFVFLYKPYGGTGFIQVSDSGLYPVSSYATSITNSTLPQAFPGTFRTCANNQSDKPSTVSLTVAVDS